MDNSENPGRGRQFEAIVAVWLHKQGIQVRPDFTIDVGANEERKPHRFDLGSADPPVLVECKCHTWTSGGNAPSAKLTVWNEAMHYFACSPELYRKMLVVSLDLRREQSLGEHYVKRYGHLIPRGVEIWEYDGSRFNAVQLYPRP